MLGSQQIILKVEKYQEFADEYMARREVYKVGAELWAYDTYIQESLKEDHANLTAELPPPPEHLITRINLIATRGPSFAVVSSKFKRLTRTITKKDARVMLRFYQFMIRCQVKYDFSLVPNPGEYLCVPITIDHRKRPQRRRIAQEQLWQAVRSFVRWK